MPEALDSSLGLLIPYGLGADARPVAASRALRSEAYACPACRGPLILRRGPILRPHFAHAQADPQCGFEGEGARHLLAKHAVLFAVYRWKKCGGPPPEIVRRCTVCGDSRRQPLPPRIARAHLEWRIRLPDRGDAIADVALLDRSNNLVAAVEIRDTHRVDAPKRERLLGAAWVELDADAVLAEPDAWKPLAEGNLNPWPCRCARGRPLAVTMRGGACHVDACPRTPRARGQRTYANVSLDCRECPDCIGVEKRTAAGESPRPTRVICAAARRQSP